MPGISTDHVIAEDHTDLIPAPINKKVLRNKDGETRDIINEVLQQYSDSRNQLKQFGQYFQGDTLLETCSNIWHFWKEKVKYKIDPEGVQWIKSPAALWNSGHDPFGDCKSFAIACAVSLHALDIKGAFRFVSFGSNTTAPTHVFAVVKDKGQEIIIDCVWTSFNSTKAWSKKWDYNMTSIYSISGIDTGNGRGTLDLDHINIDGLTVGELDLLSLKQRLEIEQMLATKKHGIGSLHDNAYEVEIMGVNNALAELGRSRGMLKFKHQRIVAFGHAGSPLKRVPQVSPHRLTGRMYSHLSGDDDDSIEGISGNKKAKVKSTSAPKTSNKLTKQIKRNEAGKGISKKNANKLEKLNIVVKKKKDGLLKSLVKVATAPVRLAAQGALKLALPKNAAFFLYTFLPEKVLAKVPPIVMAKRSKALKAKDSIIKKIGMKETTFTNIIRSGIMNAFGMTPEDTLAKWMKDANFIGFVQAAFAAAGTASGLLSGALGIDFSKMQEDFAAPEDWGGVSAETKNDVANQVTNSYQPAVPNSGGYFPGGGYNDVMKQNSAADGTDTSYTDGSGRWWPGGYTDADGVHHEEEPVDENDHESKYDKDHPKGLPGVVITAPAKSNSTPLLLLGGLALLAVSAGKGKKKK